MDVPPRGPSRPRSAHDDLETTAPLPVVGTGSPPLSSPRVSPARPPRTWAIVAGSCAIIACAGYVLVAGLGAVAGEHPQAQGVFPVTPTVGFIANPATATATPRASVVRRVPTQRTAAAPSTSTAPPSSVPPSSVASSSVAEPVPSVITLPSDILLPPNVTLPPVITLPPVVTPPDPGVATPADQRNSAARQPEVRTAPVPGPPSAVVAR